MPLQKIPNENDPTFEQRILKHEHGLVGTLKHEEIERRGFIEQGGSTFFLHHFEESFIYLQCPIHNVSVVYYDAPVVKLLLL